MNELKELKALVVGPKLVAQERLSPSSINTYLRCPRKYFYTYIAKLKEKPSEHLVKGSIVHKVLEDFFRGYTKDLDAKINKLFEASITKHEQELKDLELPLDKLEEIRKDCWNMIEEYYTGFKRRLKFLQESKKAENESHAFYLMKPTFREKWVESKDLHLCGYIDRVNEGYDGLVTLGDYKTSSKYGIGLPEEYKLQLALYSLLWQDIEKKAPDFVAVDFLRYGETYILEVTPSLLKYAHDKLNYVYARTRSTDIKDYPLTENNLCKWCQFYNICSGKASWEKEIREQKIKEIIKKKE